MFKHCGLTENYLGWFLCALDNQWYHKYDHRHHHHFYHDFNWHSLSEL